MKFINKLLLLALIVGFVACDATDLDLQDNPNAVTPEKASVNDLYNEIQLDFAGAFLSAQGTGGAISRMYHMGGNFTYEAWSAPTTFNGLWFTAYSALFPDIDAMLALTEERGQDVHTGSAKIMKAYVLMELVDNLGNVPLSEAGQGTDVISPKSDDGATVYAAAVALLDEAITLLDATTVSGPSNDFYYGGDPAKWSTLAKTLKLRAAVTTRLVDGSAAGTINALVSAGDLIDETSEDFEAQSGSQRNNPNSRHYMYNNHYETGDGSYLSNYYMWLLRAGKVNADDNIVKDPRLRYYFYRQVDDAIGQDPTTYSCHFSVLPTDPDGRPAHYDDIDPRLPYCVAFEDGYSGRDHANGEGTPPDGPVRTHFGLYPGGGQFDDNTFEDTRQSGTTGGLGAGIYPIMLASYVDFLRAEAALTLGTNDDARVLLESGMRKSIAKVMSFKSLVPSTFSRAVEVRGGEPSTVEALFEPTADDIDEYVNLVLAKYDAAGADQLDIVMTEYYIALWGNGIEAYNMYRRTGKPNNMAPTLEPAGGTFSRSFFLPSVHVNRNSNATQKELSQKVFWDDGSVDLY